MKRIVSVLCLLAMSVGCKNNQRSDLSTLLFSQDNIQMSESDLSRSVNYCDNLYPSGSVAPMPAATGGDVSDNPSTSPAEPTQTVSASGGITASGGTGGTSSTATGTRSRFPSLHPSRVSALTMASLETVSNDIYLNFYSTNSFSISSLSGETLLTGQWQEVDSQTIELIVNNQGYLVGVTPQSDQQPSFSSPSPALCLSPDVAQPIVGYAGNQGGDVSVVGSGGVSGGGSVIPVQADIYGIHPDYQGTWCYQSGFPYNLGLVYDGSRFWTAFYDNNRAVLEGLIADLNFYEDISGLYQSYDGTVHFNNGYVPSYDNAGIAQTADVSFDFGDHNYLRVIYGLGREAIYTRSGVEAACSVYVPSEEAARLPH